MFYSRCASCRATIVVSGIIVIPAHAGIQSFLTLVIVSLDSRFRGNDVGVLERFEFGAEIR